MNECSHPMAPNEEELWRHVLDDDPLPSEKIVHVRQCSLCQTQITTYTTANNFLLKKLYRSECPDPTRLNLYCAGYLPIDDVFLIDAHVRICPLCAHELSEIRQLLANFDPFPEAPVMPRERVARIFALFVPWQPQLILRGDDSPPPSSHSWPRQYRANDLNISLHLSRASNGEVLLIGLLSSADPGEFLEELEGILAELYIIHEDEKGAAYEVKQLLMHTQVDDLGNLVFKNVPPGTFTMHLYVPMAEVVIEGLSIENN
ncbi:MAG TPA: hypothetical protein VL485_14885 [Ktedonobacteraceae bacterium]|jgi:hypothetical protein|nr:hypothetical protein [Ktedonobacteraceae bacterium]